MMSGPDNHKQEQKIMDTEKDPNGMAPSEPGAKLDDGKPKAAQILRMFSRALWEVARVGTFGAAKYSMGGWQFVEDGINRYADAEMRHWLKRGMGREIDGDSRLLHLSQEAWNKLAELELYLREMEGSGEVEAEKPRDTFLRRHDDIKDSPMEISKC
jgi:hypothetical protein